MLRFQEKGARAGKSRCGTNCSGTSWPISRRRASSEDDKDRPLFRSSSRPDEAADRQSLTTKRICELVKRRLKDAGLPTRLSPHSFRVTAITDLLTQGVPLEDVQYLAGHAEPRTTGLYDRRQKKVTRNIVERISI